MATIVYPAEWYTEIEPPDVACRYFNPEPFTIPSDPSTLVTAVMASTTDAAYADAVAAATDPDSWDVNQSQEITLDGLPATLVESCRHGR